MSPVFAARRRAEEFQAMLEGTASVEGSDDRLRELYELVGQLRETPQVVARPEFVAELREQLVDEARSAARTGKGADVAARLTLARSTRERRRERRLAAAVGGLALVGASTGMAVASQSALPGDPLYPLKRAIENAQTGVQTADDAKGKTLLDNAAGRLDEVDELTRKSDDADAIAATLDTFTSQASEASELLITDYEQNGDKESVEELRNFTADSMDTLTGLQEAVPADARSALITAARTLTQIDRRALLACPSCGPAVVTEIPALTTVAVDGLEDLLIAVTKPIDSTVEGKQPVDRKKRNNQPKAPESTPPDLPVVPDLPILNDPTPSKDGDKSGGGLIDDTLKTLTGQDKDGKGGKNKGDKDKGLIEKTTDGLNGLLGGLLGN